MILYCFPFAGGSASIYREWATRLGPDIDVRPIEYPGRGRRVRMRACQSVPELVETVARDITGGNDAPFAFFGYSLGGIVAYELAHWRRARGLSLPCRLFVAACAAPGTRTPSGLHRLNAEALKQKLADFGGTPDELLHSAELMELVLPVIRADFTAIDSYIAARRGPLDLPIDVLVGDHDPFVDSRQAEAWAERTSRGGELFRFRGSHFFMNTQLGALLAVVRERLNAVPPLERCDAEQGDRV